MLFAQLALIAIIVALIPLSWIWVKGGFSFTLNATENTEQGRAEQVRNRYRKLTWLTAFLTLDLILFGSFTRLTDSGLGCPDWPGCYGESNPLLAHHAIRAAESAMPFGPVTVSKAWIEMLHRYFAMAVGVLIIALVILAWRHRRQLRHSPWLATAVLVLVCVQGAFGAWTVTLKLQPIIVTTHLLLGMGLFAALTVLGAYYQRAAQNFQQLSGLAKAALLGALLLAMQIALGGWVSTNYAVLACTDFPLCNGTWVPQMDFVQGFTLWRALGKTAQGDLLTMDALVAIHWLHRVFAVVVVSYLATLVWRLRQHAALAPWGNRLAALLLLQLLTGISNIVLQWPLLGAVAHNGGAALLLFVLVRINVLLWSKAPAVTTATQTVTHS